MAVVEIISADITYEESQKAWDKFCYFISLSLKKYVENGGDIIALEKVLEKRGEMTFYEWYDYIADLKAKGEI